MKVKNMYNLHQRILKGIKILDTDNGSLHVEISDDAIEAWTEVYGEPPTEESFSKFINKALDAKMKNEKKIP